jgi:hypothetical protein
MYVMYVQYKISWLYSISCRFVCNSGTLYADQIGYVPEFFFSEIICSPLLHQSPFKNNLRKIITDLFLQPFKRVHVYPISMLLCRKIN